MALAHHYASMTGGRVAENGSTLDYDMLLLRYCYVYILNGIELIFMLNFFVAYIL